MIVNTEKLLTVSSFAKFKGVSHTTVYSWISEKKEKSVKIDEKVFVIMNKEDYKEYKTLKNYQDEIKIG